jgi:2-keto-4-pentenoate hydratase/2-oxohepta-3-ene-1,7-dioic acid hydratase in catechol pathway
MRFARVARPDGPAFVEIVDDHAVLLEGHPFAGVRRTDQVAPLQSVRLLAPIIPTKILCVGRNYADHAAELNNEVPEEPLIFLKPTTAVVGPGDNIVLPALSNNVHHEAELVAVIGRLTRNIAVEDALDAVFGYTCGNDVTARDIQRSDKQWTRGKGFDTFCPIGPVIDTDVDPSDGLAVRCTVNGEVRQESSTADLIFNIAQLVAYCAAFTTLLPGDVILTGTPAGVGPLHDGDSVTVSVEGIGDLTNSCVAES